MFCDEPVIKVYTGFNEGSLCDNDCFLDMYHELAYHVEEGCSIVLETEHYVFFLDSNGVHKYSSPAKPRNNDEWLNPCVDKKPGELHWVEKEQTLFEGECILDVIKDKENFVVRFTDFELKIIPYESGKMNVRLGNQEHCSYNCVLGCDRWLKRKCGCGGNGEILMDFTDDFVVRCKACKKSTWAGINLIDAIDDWNDGELHCDLSDISIE